jgi:Icc-related predicted phosphoesterase
MPTNGRLRIAAVGDLHYVKGSQAALNTWLPRVAEHADVLVLCGDLTDYGRVDEAQELGRELTSTLRLPIIAVLGNHDFEGGHPDAISDVLGQSGIHVLDGGSFEVHGVGFAGIKGFAGGFGRGALGPWGEPIIKQFVQEAIAEALKLETALARLRTPHRIAVLHYSPVVGTVAGEPPEIYPYLGSSRLAEPLARYPVTAVFHGHVHNGVLESRHGDTPIYNVSLPLMMRLSPELPFHVLTLDLETG